MFHEIAAYKVFHFYPSSVLNTNTYPLPYQPATSPSKDSMASPKKRLVDNLEDNPAKAPLSL
jgi:hypothetical protein